MALSANYISEFRAGGMTPQEAAIGDHERTVYDVRGFQGPEATPECSRGADLFWDAEKAALAAVGADVKGGYLSVEGFDEKRTAVCRFGVEWRA